ncbi:MULTISPECIES: M20 family metallopeptidase [Paenibacillus]|uniref:M20 family metallopeptidase n=1 Tax=Paenibacillus TaxID=44249 RepID=UPI00117F654E|nr:MULTISPECIES: M20 family metallopeptidase [Paenibacillus]
MLLQQLQESGFTLTNVHDSEPSYYNPDTPEVKCLMQVYQGVTGEQQAKPFVMGGGTYARKLPYAVGLALVCRLMCHRLTCLLAMVKFGPDEVQSIPNLITALKIYIVALLELNELYPLG